MPARAFSGTSLLHMVKRAEGDSILAEQLGLRKDVPRHLFQQLIAKASDDVRKRLEHERPEMCEADRLVRGRRRRARCNPCSVRSRAAISWPSGS